MHFKRFRLKLITVILIVKWFHFEIRKTLVDYDDVINTQREIIYQLRKQAFSDELLQEKILDIIHNEVEDLVTSFSFNDRNKEDIDLFFQEFSKIIPSSKSHLEDIENITGDSSILSKKKTINLPHLKNSIYLFYLKSYLFILSKKLPIYSI